jgi:hypothetical protein
LIERQQFRGSLFDSEARKNIARGADISSSPSGHGAENEIQTPLIDAAPGHLTSPLEDPRARFIEFGTPRVVDVLERGGLVRPLHVLLELDDRLRITAVLP